MKRLRILIVDDSAIYRRLLQHVLSDFDDIEIVGTASDGREALRMIEQLRPDLMTLDVKMPHIDGLGVLHGVQRRGWSTQAIVLSAYTEAGAELTTSALQLGAFDFVLKPTVGGFAANVEKLRSELFPRIRAFADSRQTESEKVGSANRPLPNSLGTQSIEVVAIGVSTGGPAALTQVLPQLPRDFPAPILIVQHMPAKFTDLLARDLDRICDLDVAEAQHCERVEAGQVRIAPGGQQMKAYRESRTVRVSISDEPSRGICRPSVDLLFESLAQEFGSKTLAAVLTGMGDDGTAGCRALQQAGSAVIAQDRASCVVYGMPRQVIESGLADVVCSLDSLPWRLCQRVGKRPAAVVHLGRSFM